MKIGVLTLPLHINYGGNLQAYALMTVLKRMGHEVWLINRCSVKPEFWWHVKSITKHFLKKYLLRKRGVDILEEVKYRRELPSVSQNTRKFLDRYIQPMTEPCHSTTELRRNVGKHGFNAIVVGSDQVWRPEYSANIEDYFLGFYSGNARRVVYAASFGVKKWMLTNRQTSRFRRCLKRFDAVSVREDSGVQFCREYFDTHAVHLIDPTLLLDIGDYRELLLEHVAAPSSCRTLAVYILDKDAGKSEIIRRLSELHRLKVASANRANPDAMSPFHERIASSVEDWLDCFARADFVFVDSFHGCVFSILFHKPFLAYVNKDRGAARFESLLRLFQLEHCLISAGQEVSVKDLNPVINWKAVDEILEREREKALCFLKDALGGL